MAIQPNVSSFTYSGEQIDLNIEFYNGVNVITNRLIVFDEKKFLAYSGIPGKIPIFYMHGDTAYLYQPTKQRMLVVEGSHPVMSVNRREDNIEIGLGYSSTAFPVDWNYPGWIGDIDIASFVGDDLKDAVIKRGDGNTVICEIVDETSNDVIRLVFNTEPIQLDTLTLIGPDENVEVKISIKSSIGVSLPSRPDINSLAGQFEVLHEHSESPDDSQLNTENDEMDEEGLSMIIHMNLLIATEEEQEELEKEFDIQVDWPLLRKNYEKHRKIILPWLNLPKELEWTSP